MMDSPYPGGLRVWDGPAPRPGPEDPPPAPPGVADQLFAREALYPAARLARRGCAAEPYSLQWFLSIEGHRHGRHGRWIPRLLEFAKHGGETLLGLGNGLGTDWLQYARHGASVVVCGPSADHLDLIRRNFELRGLCARFLHAPPTALPLESGSIDVVCLGDLLPDVGQPRAVVDEVFRVLKPGGKVLATAPARYDVDFWCKTCFFRRRPDGAAARFSARRLRRLFAAFTDHRIRKRQLRRSEVPHLWRVLPLPLLERLMGRLLVLKAFKPLCTVLPAQAAA